MQSLGKILVHRYQLVKDFMLDLCNFMEKEETRRSRDAPIARNYILEESRHEIAYLTNIIKQTRTKTLYSNNG